MVRLASAVLALVAFPAVSQESTYGGSWTVAATLPNGFMYKAELTIEGAGGTWKAFIRDPDNPCAGVKAPIAVIKSTPDELVLRVKESEALPGCNDGTVRFKRTEDNTLKGNRGPQQLVATRR